MTKLKWNREPVNSVLNSEYWTDPVNGFDKGWHDRQKAKNERKQRLLNQNIDLGLHEDHDLSIEKLDSGPHAGKLVCVSCNNKFIRWLSKGIF
jgi:hypothetical protein